jgi:O-antigen ligase
LTLWRAGVRILAAHPLLGVGPDNFHLVYGDYIDLPRFDTRVHANNMYLEMVVGGGVIGGLAFAWLCVSALTTTSAAVLMSGPQTAAAAAGIAAAGTAIAVHGLVDSFLSFTCTYVLISVTLGLAVATASMDHLDANRI